MARHGKRRGALAQPPPVQAPAELAWLDEELLRELRAIPDPPYVPPTPGELERRNEAFDEILRLREVIGPIGVSVADLIRQDRGWPEEEPQTDG
ncbi:MAG: hypothetical protein NTZ05_03220 [Chloroflexi bacterium]|nr:hypothetical protein [Chloroflexota bacterium]